jgi:hypothetical protein
MSELPKIAEQFLANQHPVQPVRFENAKGELVGGCLFIRGAKEFEALMSILPKEGK